VQSSPLGDICGRRYQYEKTFDFSFSNFTQKAALPFLFREQPGNHLKEE
jgi:hypothetical protein